MSESTSPASTHHKSTLASANAWRRVVAFFSGFTLATVLLLILLLQTWLATLEQVDHGLHATLRKYFDPQAWYVIGELVLPDFMGSMKLLIPMPGGYLVMALLFVNLLLGGIVRARKGWGKAGVLISHFGILFMIGSAAVTERMERRGTMDFFEGETSNVAEDYFEYVIEVTEHTAGAPERVHVVRGRDLADVTGSQVRTIRLPDLPFDLQVTRYAANTQAMAVTEMAPAAGEPIVDGYFLFKKPNEIDAERNLAGCYAKVLPKDGAPLAPFILTGGSFQPYSTKVGERVFSIDIRKFLWEMPFSVRLDRARSEYYPNTQKPKLFESTVTRIENGAEAKVEIKMNEPMRYEGLTFYQRMMGAGQGGMAGAQGRPYSQLEVVSNPADQWPKYALYVVTLGLFVHFVMKLVQFLLRTTKRHSSPA